MHSQASHESGERSCFRGFLARQYLKMMQRQRPKEVLPI